MHKKYEIKITQHAENSLRELAEYIAFVLMAPKTAIAYITALRDGMNSLETFPGRIALTEDEPWRTYGVHKLLVKNHFVYFWIDEENNKVQITDVIYAKSDQRKSLEKMPLV